MPPTAQMQTLKPRKSRSPWTRTRSRLVEALGLPGPRCRVLEPAPIESVPHPLQASGPQLGYGSDGDMVVVGTYGPHIHRPPRPCGMPRGRALSF